MQIIDAFKHQFGFSLALFTSLERKERERIKEEGKGGEEESISLTLIGSEMKKSGLRRRIDD